MYGRMCHLQHSHTSGPEDVLRIDDRAIDQTAHRCHSRRIDCPHGRDIDPLAKFGASPETMPGDGPSIAMLQRIESIKASPLPPNYDSPWQVEK